jgi:capsular polysaccharide transport system permease protein
MTRLLKLSSRSLMIALVVVPLLLYGLYLAFVATDRFVSESVVSVQQAGNDAAGALPGAALLLAGINPPSHADTLLLKDFVHSQALLLQLESQLGLRKHYAGVGLDWPYRLAPDATLEDFVRYVRARIEVSFDDRSSLLKVRVQGLDPDYAQRLNAALLDASERFVNETSHRIARERLRFAELELERAGTRLQQAAGEVLAFQSRNQLLDPTFQAQASGSLTADLEASRAKLEAELGGLRGFLNDNAYQVMSLKSQISALSRQIDAERQRATGTNAKGSRLNKLALDFQGLQLQAEFARDAYKVALAAVENARIDATRKIKSLVVLEPPSRPETAEYPLVAYNLATLLALCVLLYAIVRLVLATIREHQD